MIVGSPNVNPGYKLVNDPLYPNIARDYDRMFRTLKSLPCDIFLGAHGSYFDMEAKLAHGGSFIDPKGYRAYVSEREEAFRKELRKQSASHP